MALRDLARRALLTIPRVRRFYAYTQELRLERDALAARCAELDGHLRRLRSAQDDLERARQELEAAVAARKQAEAAARAASEERESIELRLYALTSDFQRAVNASEIIRAKLAETEQKIEALRRKSDPS